MDFLLLSSNFIAFNNIFFILLIQKHVFKKIILLLKNVLNKIKKRNYIKSDCIVFVKTIFVKILIKKNIKFHDLINIYLNIF